jgi:hypothetical protein
MDVAHGGRKNARRTFPTVTDVEKSSAHQLLFGKVLLWGSFDERGVATALLKRPLEEVCRSRAAKLKLLVASEPGNVICPDATLGLALWTISDSSRLDAICSAIAGLRRHSPDTRCCVLVDAYHQGCMQPLAESGAQIVASQLPSLEKCVRLAAKQAPLSTRGFHPLTSNLVRLLPW